MVKELQIQLRDAINPILDEYKLILDKNNASYTDRDIKFTLSLSRTNSLGETKAERDFKLNATLYGLDADKLGTKIDYNGTTYTITGLLPNRRKNNIQLTRVKDGKVFVAPAQSIVREVNRRAEYVAT